MSILRKEKFMFYDIFLALCIQKNVKPNNVTKAIGLSTAAATDWKNGSVPRDITLKKLANYFDVPVEHFKVQTDEKALANIQSPFTDEEIALIIAYRSQPEVQTAVKRILGINSDYIEIYNAANSEENNPPQTSKILKGEINKMKIIPFTDQDLK